MPVSTLFLPANVDEGKEENVMKTKRALKVANSTMNDMIKETVMND